MFGWFSLRYGFVRIYCDFISGDDISDKLDLGIANFTFRVIDMQLKFGQFFENGIDVFQVF